MKTAITWIVPASTHEVRVRATKDPGKRIETLDHKARRAGDADRHSAGRVSGTALPAPVCRM
ncbi:MAG: hypothetical protein ACI9IV_002484 [Paracoccaceae bacterium]